MSVYLVAGVAAPTAPATLAAHLPTARPRHYPSDTSDAEWAVLAPHVPAGTGRGRPIIYPRRDVVDAIRYLDRTGCQWDALPADFPHHKLSGEHCPHLCAYTVYRSASLSSDSSS